MTDNSITMPALTLWQPWASLVAHQVKTIETRHWRAPQSVIGKRIAIHAAAKKPGPAMGYEPEWADDACAVLGIETLDALPLGSVVCTARLARCAEVLQWMNGHVTVGREGEWIEIDQWGDFRVGRWLWFFDDIRILAKPVRVAGGQGFWHWRHAPQEAES